MIVIFFTLRLHIINKIVKLLSYYHKATSKKKMYFVDFQHIIPQ